MKRPGITKTGLTKVIPGEQPETTRDRLLYDYDIDDATLKSAHIRALDEILDFLQRRFRAAGSPRTPFLTVNIDGFATRTGTAAHNQLLSQHREQTVHHYLSTRFAGRGLPATAVTVNTRFHGFKDTVVVGEDPIGRCVRIAVAPPGVTPKPIPMPVDPVVTPVPHWQRPAQRVVAWINAFIPRDVPGVTFPVRQGPFQGSTYVLGPMMPNIFPPAPLPIPIPIAPGQLIPSGPPAFSPMVQPAFLTNNRGFVAQDSRDISFFKMHAGAAVDFSLGSPRITEKSLLGGESVQIEPATGMEVQRGVGDASRLRLTTVPVVSPNPFLPLSPNSIALRFELATSIPLIPGSQIAGDIDVVGTLTIDPVARLLIFDVALDDFPAFECYIAADGGTPTTVFQVSPIKGLTPLNLPGPPTQTFHTTMSF